MAGFSRKRDRMVRLHLAQRGVGDPHVLEAMRRVPREEGRVLIRDVRLELHAGVADGLKKARAPCCAPAITPRCKLPRSLRSVATPSGACDGPGSLDSFRGGIS